MRTRIGFDSTPDGRRVIVSRLIDAPPRRVWRCLIDTDRWTEWGPSVTGVRCPDRFVRRGSRGQVRIPIGLWLPFVVTECDHLRWTWRIAGVTATGHAVSAVDGRARVSFELPPLAAPYAVICWLALRRLARVVDGE